MQPIWVRRTPAYQYKCQSSDPSRTVLSPDLVSPHARFTFLIDTIAVTVAAFLVNIAYIHFLRRWPFYLMVARAAAMNLWLLVAIYPLPPNSRWKRNKVFSVACMVSYIAIFLRVKEQWGEIWGEMEAGV